MGKRGQVSMEYTLLVVFSLVLVLPVAFSFLKSSQTDTRAESAQVQHFADAVITQAERLYAMGPGSKAVIEERLPKSISNIEMRTDNQGNYEMVINVAGREYAYPTKVPFNTSISGGDATQGTNSIRLEMKQRPNGEVYSWVAVEPPCQSNDDCSDDKYCMPDIHECAFCDNNVCAACYRPSHHCEGACVKDDTLYETCSDDCGPCHAMNTATHRCSVSDSAGGCASGLNCVHGVCMAPRCSDGTPFGICSDNRPSFCTDYGVLVDDCYMCNCPENKNCVGGSCVASDTTPPARSNRIPTLGTVLPTYATSIQIGLTTDELAICKYSTSDIDFSQMDQSFSTIGTTSHTTTMNLIGGAANTIYVRCTDFAQPNPNVNTDSYVISFSIETPTDYVAYWKFEDDLKDSSSYGNDGTAFGSPAFVAGKAGKAISFNGVASTYVSIGTPRILNMTTSDFTISLWAKATGGTNGKGIISKGGWGAKGYFISEAYDPAYRFYFGISDGTTYQRACTYLDTQSGYPDGTHFRSWTHIVGVKTATSLKAYVNGDLIETYTGTIPDLSNPTQAMYIGKSYDNYAFYGLVDEVKIWKRALSPEEIHAEYSAAGSDTSLPVMSSGKPSGTLAAGTTQVPINLTTDIAAACKYSTSSSTAYASMTAFATTGGTFHQSTVSVSSGNTYHYYVKCNSLNTNYDISFSVAAIESEEITKGIGLHGSKAGQYNYLSDIRSMGITMVRDDITWANLEYGTPATYHWTSFDSRIDALLAAGIEPVLILDYSNCLYNFASPCSYNYVPSNEQQFAAFKTAYGNYVYNVTRHYLGKVKYFEIWNEPNIFWDPKPINQTTSDHWVALIKEGYTRAKQANPNAFIITGGLYLGTGTVQLFYQNLYNKGAKNYFDAVAAHPYCDASQTLPISDQGKNCSNIKYLFQIRDIMAANGDGNKPIWITEMGQPTEGCKDYGFGSCPTNLTEEGQKIRMTNFYNTIKTSLPEVKAVFWYDYIDDCVARTKTSTDCPDMDVINPTCHADTECRFGLVRTDLTKKPAYYAYSSIS
jgi:uncharacterized protein (UPF0333 family)